MRNPYILTSLILATLAFASPARAQQAPPEPQPLVVTAEIMPARASRERTREPSVLQPGDVVRYRLTFTNVTGDSVRNVRFDNPVPAGLRYVAGSAQADRPDVTIEFSIDGGAAYSERPEVERVVNGQKVRRPAPPELYTHVRWMERGWVRSEEYVTAQFEVQLPATTLVVASSDSLRTAP